MNFSEPAISRRDLGVTAFAMSVSLILTSCAKDDEDKNNGGKSVKNEILTDEDLKGFTIYVGDKTFDPKSMGVSLTDPKNSSVFIEKDGRKAGVSIDESTYRKVLNESGSTSFVNAEVSFDGGEFTITQEGKPGVGFDEPSKFLEDFAKSFSEDEKDFTLESREREPDITLEEAQNFADVHNRGIAESHFTIGGKRVKGVSPDEYASFFTIDSSDGSLKAVPNEETIRKFAEGFPKELNTERKDGKAVVDSPGGKVLKEIDEIRDGVEVSDVEKITSMISEAIEKGEFGALEVPAEIDKARVEELFRRIEVNKTTKRVQLFENEKVVYDFPVAVGAPSTPSDSGEFSVHTQLKVQDMGCTPKYDYCSRGVKWITYYNGGEGFHAAPWHSNFGNPSSEVSNGCINMRTDDAHTVYTFAQVGTPVKVF